MKDNRKRNICVGEGRDMQEDSVDESCIREMVRADAEEVLSMMRVFYASDAVLSDGSEEIFLQNVECCLGGSPYLEGYVFESGGRLQGYAMTAKSFSTEFGRECVWIEDLYMKPECRSLGLGTRFFAYIEQKHPHVLLRLEVDWKNKKAIRVYEKCGYEVLPYVEMKKKSGG